MITLRKSASRGYADLGWLKSWHTFSFASYHDPRFIHSSCLRVINQDIVQAGGGFPPHPHDNMEILTYILRGAISHRDSMGNEARISAGEFQLMSAGTGVTHSEFNRDNGDLELLQIWLLTNQRNAEPSYQQKRFAPKNGLQLVVSPESDAAALHAGSLSIRQNARIWRGQLNAGDEIVHTLQGGTVWLQQISGSISALGHTLEAGDGAEIKHEPVVSIRAHTAGEFLLFDMP